jgi:hypothetical protein
VKESTMLAEIYLLQLELAAHASEKPAPKQDYNFVPFALEAVTPETFRSVQKSNERHLA